MVGWHHRLKVHEFEKTLGDNERQGSLMCCSPRGCKESDTTEQLNKEVTSTIEKNKVRWGIWRYNASCSFR